MTQNAPHIFDRPLIRTRLARAFKQGPADFLLARAVEDICDRLLAVKREFSQALDLGTPLPLLAGALPCAHVTRAAPLREALGTGRFAGVLADEEALPFAPESFDLVVSALALHMVNDLPGALVQIRRTLKPDGLFMAALAGGQTLHELRTALAAAEDEIEGGASPRVAPFADLRDMGGLLQRAGFALPVTDVDTMVVRYASMFGLLRDLRALGATNALVMRRKQPLKRAMLVRAAEIYHERFADADGRVRATFEIIHVSGWAPHESQQKPLKPGSAQMRLADALGVKEHKS